MAPFAPEGINSFVRLLRAPPRFDPKECSHNIPRKECPSLICNILDQFNIVGKKDLFPNQLSGGQQHLA
jgi:hypothetical protein